MAAKYLETMLTDSVRRAEEAYYGRAGKIVDPPPRNPLGEPEKDFIAARDSFYQGTVSETGWPYIQHRGDNRWFDGSLSGSCWREVYSINGGQCR